MTASVATSPAGAAIPPPEPALVLFGRDEAGKPHAAWFDAANAELAVKAAKMAGLMVFHLKSPEHRALAAKLAKGRLFASGRAFTPFVRAELYARLVEFAGDAAGIKPVGPAFPPEKKPIPADAKSSGSVAGTIPETVAASAPDKAKVGETATPTPTGGQGAPALSAPKPSLRPETLSAITIGSVVLASLHVSDGWWEAVVQSQNGEVFTLKWRDYPIEPAITRRRSQLALPPENR